MPSRPPEILRRCGRAAAWLALAALGAAWAALLLLSPSSPARGGPPEEPAAETSGQVSWVDPEAGAFGLDTGEREMEFLVGSDTVITRDRQPISLDHVQPGDWVVSCAYRLEADKLRCLRLEIQTPSGEEGLE